MGRLTYRKLCRKTKNAVEAIEESFWVILATYADKAGSQFDRDKKSLVKCNIHAETNAHALLCSAPF